MGSRAVLPCQSETHTEVDWRYRNVTHPDHQYVWNRNVIVDGYRDRFRIETNAVGSYNLVIFPVQLNDSGIYECIEDGGFGKVHKFRLTVELGEYGLHSWLSIGSVATVKTNLVSRDVLYSTLCTLQICIVLYCIVLYFMLLVCVFASIFNLFSIILTNKLRLID